MASYGLTNCDADYTSAAVAGGVPAWQACWTGVYKRGDTPGPVVSTQLGYVSGSNNAMSNPPEGDPFYGSIGFRRVRSTPNMLRIIPV